MGQEGLMPSTRRWRRGNIAKTFLAALLVVHMAASAQACPLPMAGVGMAFDEAAMPAACAGLAKHACLAAYIQNDQASNSSDASIAAPAARVLLLTFASSLQPASRLIAAAVSSVHSRAPPPRLLFCRMLE